MWRKSDAEENVREHAALLSWKTKDRDEKAQPKRKIGHDMLYMQPLLRRYTA